MIYVYPLLLPYTADHYCSEPYNEISHFKIAQYINVLVHFLHDWLVYKMEILNFKAGLYIKDGALLMTNLITHVLNVNAALNEFLQLYVLVRTVM